MEDDDVYGGMATPIRSSRQPSPTPRLAPSPSPSHSSASGTQLPPLMSHQHRHTPSPHPRTPLPQQQPPLPHQQIPYPTTYQVHSASGHVNPRPISSSSKPPSDPAFASNPNVNPYFTAVPPENGGRDGRSKSAHRPTDSQTLKLKSQDAVHGRSHSLASDNLGGDMTAAQMEDTPPPPPPYSSSPQPPPSIVITPAHITTSSSVASLHHPSSHSPYPHSSPNSASASDNESGRSAVSSRSASEASMSGSEHERDLRPEATRNISAPELGQGGGGRRGPRMERLQVPHRSVSEPVSHTKASSGKGKSKKGSQGQGGTSPLEVVDMVDVLDETDPLGRAWHHDGPYEAASTALRQMTRERTLSTKKSGGGGLHHQTQGSISTGDLSKPMGIVPGQIFPKFMMPPTQVASAQQPQQQQQQPIMRMPSDPYASHFPPQLQPGMPLQQQQQQHYHHHHHHHQQPPPPPPHDPRVAHQQVPYPQRVQSSRAQEDPRQSHYPQPQSQADLARRAAEQSFPQGMGRAVSSSSRAPPDPRQVPPPQVDMHGRGTVIDQRPPPQVVERAPSSRMPSDPRLATQPQVDQYGRVLTDQRPPPPPQPLARDPSSRGPVDHRQITQQMDAYNRALVDRGVPPQNVMRASSSRTPSDPRQSHHPQQEQYNPTRDDHPLPPPPPAHVIAPSSRKLTKSHRKPESEPRVDTYSNDTPLPPPPPTQMPPMQLPFPPQPQPQPQPSRQYPQPPQQLHHQPSQQFPAQPPPQAYPPQPPVSSRVSRSVSDSRALPPRASEYRPTPNEGVPIPPKAPSSRQSNSPVRVSRGPLPSPPSLPVQSVDTILDREPHPSMPGQFTPPARRPSPPSQPPPPVDPSRDPSRPPRSVRAPSIAPSSQQSSDSRSHSSGGGNNRLQPSYIPKHLVMPAPLQNMGQQPPPSQQQRTHQRAVSLNNPAYPATITSRPFAASARNVVRQEVKVELKGKRNFLRKRNTLDGHGDDGMGQVHYSVEVNPQPVAKEAKAGIHFPRRFLSKRRIDI
ncbi:hypothetical protein JAAARDRAFT_29384 [Jaapia argillacea MUCL 33604]|uniref:Uncharacterized protein n=1 Tax=Jaapia argillacea MUCL 33604 TaxID=933084 RepID=A0A067QB37_9AGAM|nr:hypothetical protein JAAARDRAFT_29384 [Jaapia argillacea MUCL 33604]